MKIEPTSFGEFKISTGNGDLYFSFLSETSFHLRQAYTGRSFAAVALPLVSSSIKAKEEGGVACFCYKQLSVYVREDLSLQAYIDGIEVIHQFPLKEIERKEPNDPYESFSLLSSSPIYGLGDKAGPLDKRGYSFRNWNTDDPSAHVESMPSLYKSIPFFVMFMAENSVGIFFDNTSNSLFDFNKKDPNRVTISYGGGGFSCFYFIGPMPEVIGEYTSLVGRNPLPPRWALGHQQSRWSYENAKEVEEVVDSYQKEGIPLSAVYLDIAYMDEYKDFTVSEERFPDISCWLGKMHEKGVHVIPIIDAGVKAEEGYFLYDEGMENGYFSTLNGEVYHNEVWPGDSVFPAFLNRETRQWWAQKTADFLSLGFDGIWQDMNEPASFKGPLPLEVDMGGVTHDLAHNVYAHRMDEAAFNGFALLNKRPYLITRAAYAGTSRYAVMWTGDNQSIWEHLRLSLPQCASLSLSGVANIGVDLGGFSADATKELLIRFMEAGIFFPLYRNHSALGTRRQEGYSFDEETTALYKKAVLLRYEILPTIYDQLFLHEEMGRLPIRPLIYNFPYDEQTVNENTEIMLGDSLLLAPSLFPGQKMREAYFPDDFYSFHSGRLFPKGYNLIDCSLGHSCLFVRKNSLVVVNPKTVKDTSFPDVLRLLSTGEEARCYHYEDEGDGLSYKKGKYNLYLIELGKDGQINISYVHKGMDSHYESVEVDMLGKGTMRFPFPK